MKARSLTRQGWGAGVVETEGKKIWTTTNNYKYKATRKRFENIY